MKVREIIKLIEEDGWFPVRTRGSHRHYEHLRKRGLVTVAGKPGVDVPIGTLKSILKHRIGRIIPMRYTVVIEQGPTSYGAYVPDLPGCIAAAETRAEVVSLIREAVEFHIETLREEGMPVPEPHSTAESVEIAMA